jgi:hypothetical protein
MIKKVIKAYEALNAELQNDMPVNDTKTREIIKARLESELPHCDIKCDEENNPPDIIDACVGVARAQWINKAMEISYVNLIFGRPEQIVRIQDQLQ